MVALVPDSTHVEIKDTKVKVFGIFEVKFHIRREFKLNIRRDIKEVICSISPLGHTLYRPIFTNTLTHTLSYSHHGVSPVNNQYV